MARITKPLTATEIKNAKPKEKKYKLTDGRGLYLNVLPNGSKLWRLKYRFNDKEKEYAIGVYPTVSLDMARKVREELKTHIANGIDPNEKKKSDKLKAKKVESKKENTFYKVSQEWLVTRKHEVSENYHTRLGRALKNYIYPTIKNQSILDIKKQDIIKIIEDLRDKDLKETARRTSTIINSIYKYANTKEYAPLIYIDQEDRKALLGKKVVKHYPTLTKDKDIKGLLLAINDYSGDYSTKMALKALPYLFVRSYNIRHMEWLEIDFKAKEWTIPPHKMKTKTEFVLPLPDQVINILKEVKIANLSNVYVFPSAIHKDRPLSDNTLISAIRRMGYSKDEFVPHSFRSTFSTIAYEKANEEDGHHYTSEVIEALLAHKETNKVKKAYNHSKYKEAMRGLITWYANHLDGIKNAR